MTKLSTPVNIIFFLDCHRIEVQSIRKQEYPSTSTSKLWLQYGFPLSNRNFFPGVYQHHRIVPLLVEHTHQMDSAFKSKGWVGCASAHRALFMAWARTSEGRKRPDLVNKETKQIALASSHKHGQECTNRRGHISSSCTLRASIKNTTKIRTEAVHGAHFSECWQSCNANMISWRGSTKFITHTHT